MQAQNKIKAQIVSGNDYIVIEQHETEYLNPIILKSGEKIIIGEEHEATESEPWENWIYCTKSDNSNAGWVPRQIIDYYSETVLQDYTAKELNVEKGMRVEGNKELNGWLWAKNKSTNETGWIPMKKIKLLLTDMPPGRYLQAGESTVEKAVKT